ncbi:MAG: hypothetical protein KDA81_01665 [Planctomycetaceae bacterium]|nr:hypothetical protein [Planctomycetaceae bacterium]
MTPQYYAEFLQHIGHTVRQVGQTYWFDVAPRVYTPFPFELQLDPASLNINDVLQSDGLIARYGCRPELGVDSYRLVISDRNYDLSSQTSKSRNQTRRGLEQCACGPVDLSTFHAEGLELNRNTLQRQGRKIPANFETYWQSYYAAAARCPAATAWGARHEGQLASYLISFRIGSVENICIVRSDASRLKHYPNNAMLFTFLRNRFEDPTVTEVSIGLQSLLAGMEPLDHFKLGLGFQKQPMGQRIEFKRPWSRMLPGSMASIMSRALKPWATHERIGRVSGLLSWYASQPNGTVLQERLLTTTRMIDASESEAVRTGSKVN